MPTRKFDTTLLLNLNFADRWKLLDNAKPATYDQDPELYDQLVRLQLHFLKGSGGQGLSYVSRWSRLNEIAYKLQSDAFIVGALSGGKKYSDTLRVIGSAAAHMIKTADAGLAIQILDTAQSLLVVVENPLWRESGAIVGAVSSYCNKHKNVLDFDRLFSAGYFIARHDLSHPDDNPGIAIMKEALAAYVGKGPDERQQAEKILEGFVSVPDFFAESPHPVVRDFLERERIKLSPINRILNIFGLERNPDRRTGVQRLRRENDGQKPAQSLFAPD